MRHLLAMIGSGARQTASAAFSRMVWISTRRAGRARFWSGDGVLAAEFFAGSDRHGRSARARLRRRIANRPTRIILGICARAVAMLGAQYEGIRPGQYCRACACRISSGTGPVSCAASSASSGTETSPSGCSTGCRRLEYRGYDSAGICTIHDGALERRRAPRASSTISRASSRAEPLPGDDRHRPHPLGDPRRADRRATPIRTPPARSRSSTTASSRISSRCATN